MSRTFRGIILKIGSTLAFTLQYMSIKLAGDVPVGQTIFFRALFAMIPILILAQYTIGLRATLRTERPLLHIGRSLIGLTGMFLGFTALKYLPLADITGYGFLQPIFAVLLAAMLLKENVGVYRTAAVVVAFIGVLMMLEPHGGIRGTFSSGISAGAGIALASALIGAFVVIFIRQMSATERSETIVFYFMVTCTCAGAITLIWSRVPLTPEMTFWLVLSGLFGGFGQLGMTFSYRNAEPSLLAPFDYLAMVWAVVIGFFIFGEIPETLVLTGTGIVITSGIFIAWREHRLGRELASRAQSI